MSFYYPKLKEAGLQVIGISVDLPKFTAQFEEKILGELPDGKVPGAGEGLPFHLLSDPDHEVIKRYGLVDSGSPMGTIAVPADIIVAPDGTVEWVYQSRVYSERPSVEDILSALEKF